MYTNELISLRETSNVERLCSYLNSTLSHLDFVINNAAQTIRRSCAYYFDAVRLELELSLQFKSHQLKCLNVRTFGFCFVRLFSSFFYFYFISIVTFRIC